MGSCSLDLRLSLKPSYVPKTLSNLLEDVSRIDNLRDRLLVLNDYLGKYHDELSKVEAFKDQLPQCMLLLVDAIKALKEEIMNIRNHMGSESDEQPLLEFLSIKRATYELDDFSKNHCGEENNICIGSSQLHKLTHGDNMLKTTLDGSTIQSFRACNTDDGPDATLTLKGGLAILESNSHTDNEHALNIESKSSSKSGCRDNKRNWTPELQSRFLEALDRLGGPQVATPKQIGEVMAVEGLTNDQIKSHLQKYRIRLKRDEEAAHADLLRCIEMIQAPGRLSSAIAALNNNFPGIQPGPRMDQNLYGYN